MALDFLVKIKDRRPKHCVLLGMDVGAKTIGLALSDSEQSIAMPLKTIKRSKFKADLVELVKVIREYRVGGYIMGMPLNMDGSEGPRCQSIRDFASEFARQLPEDLANNIWIAFWDERLSTASVEDFVDKVVDINLRKAKDRGIMDKLAAQHILQGALDFIV